MNDTMTSRTLDLAARQKGLVLRAQLYEMGVSPRTLRRRIAEGLWQPYSRSVLRLRGTPDDLATRSRALGMQLPGVVLTGPSAAALIGTGPWLGVGLGTRPCAVGRPRRGIAARFVTHPGVRSHAMATWRLARSADVVIDLLRFLPVADARSVAYRALQTHVVSLGFLYEAALRLNRRAGAAQLRRVLVDVGSGARSEAELRLVKLLRSAGVTGWVTNLQVPLSRGVAVLDVAFVEPRVAVEVDGRAWHSDESRFQGDRRRQNALVRAGWTVLRFTWEDLTQRPDSVIREIRTCISAQPG
ncbi:MAG: type IV toxin-antitoxin system AbiEi family antitoxin domain-containing protein [Candidatus Nanopelagicales bacterium]|nr:type IV toxin-antitoxin system AbiEi family antitoxin domain-containing protein [Candidatus Nanopelagicales bacterium]MDZ4250241.1 type IV toxin-antitoxin system AbiEi family antitoxin domain-containing protein [Candidatus Nanopelagicales bacterium]